MEDRMLVTSVAADHVRRQGHHALDYLFDQAEISKGQGDALSAEAWHDIAEAAALILSAAN